nr:YbhB/YbcL family Raf kinase inhibitor-like protein [Neisseria subflava]
MFDRIANIALGRLKMRYRESENGSIFQTALVFVRMNKPTIGRYKMKVSSKAIVNGEFEDKYGKRGSQFSPSGMPSYSIPFEIEDAPEGTKSFAVVLEDKDAISASGFVWTHWLISDLKRTSVAENESISATDFTQGANTWASALGKFEIEEASFYGGMAPPNNRHRYELIVYALDTVLDLPRGFRFNELHFAMQGHVLDSACVSVLMMCDGMRHN